MEYITAGKPKFSTIDRNYLRSNNGRLSGDLCQQRPIHFLANLSNSAGPDISLRGGRLPCFISVFSCSSLIADKHSPDTQIFIVTSCSMWKKTTLYNSVKKTNEHFSSLQYSLVGRDLYIIQSPTRSNSLSIHPSIHLLIRTRQQWL